MDDDIVTRLRQFGDSYGLDTEAADEIERLRSINRALQDAYESLAERHRSYNDQRIDVLQKSIKELETKIDWYKAVNQQLREDLENVNRDFRRLYKTSRPSRPETDPLDAIVQAMRNRHAHHTD